MILQEFEPTTMAIRVLTNSGIESYKRRRRNEILRALEKGLLEIDSHHLKSDEFIASYLATEDALLKASSNRKFEFLLNLFLQGSNSGRINNEPDAYREVLSIVNELSERELTILFHIYSYELENGVMSGQLSRPVEHQVAYIVEKSNLERELVLALLVRLRRTGLIITHSEKSRSRDLMMSGIEIMYISPIASEIKSWVLHAIEGAFLIRS